MVVVEIVTGPRAAEFYPVLSGLSEGDKVVTRGAFLLDSQFQIRGLPSVLYSEGQAGAAGHQHGGPQDGSPRPSSPSGHEGHAPEPAEHKH